MQIYIYSIKCASLLSTQFALRCLMIKFAPTGLGNINQWYRICLISSMAVFVSFPLLEQNDRYKKLKRPKGLIWLIDSEISSHGLLASSDRGKILNSQHLWVDQICASLICYVTLKPIRLTIKISQWNHHHYHTKKSLPCSQVESVHYCCITLFNCNIRIIALHYSYAHTFFSVH